MRALSIHHLKKTYADGVEALKGIDLEVEEGEFYGLLGPNGAGKSTTIGIVVGLVNKTSGKVKVFGTDIDKDFPTAKQQIGIVPQEMNFNMFENVQDIVVNQAGYYGIPRKIAMERSERYLKKLALWEKRKTISRSLSGGMKRRLMIARALIHEPRLIILDEPTAGVDVELRRGMWEFLEILRKEGRTIILTTHYLEEAEQLCDRIAIINKGIIVENTTKKGLLAKLNKEIFIFDLKEDLTDLPNVPGIQIEKVDATTIEAEITKEQNINQVFKALEKAGIEVLSMRNKTNRLEELYLDIIEGDNK